MCIWDSEELVDGEPSPIAPSGSAGACRGDNEVESDVTVLLLHKDSVRSVTIRRDLVQMERQREGVATQAYPKIRAKVLIRHKRLYLVCTDGNRTLFKLPRASVCK